MHLFVHCTSWNSPWKFHTDLYQTDDRDKTAKSGLALGLWTNHGLSALQVMWNWAITPIVFIKEKLP